MKTKRLLFVSLFLLSTISIAGFYNSVEGFESNDATSAYGKYQNLLKTLYVPQDQGSYGNYYDWGYYSGASYAGYSNLPPGYWVYVYPNWYIWGSEASTILPTPGLSGEEIASVNGKYYNLLNTLYVPQDKGSYGDFYDWGYWSGSSYAGYTNLTPGYWVYVYPNWYIWGNTK